VVSRLVHDTDVLYVHVKDIEGINPRELDVGGAGSDIDKRNGVGAPSREEETFCRWGKMSIRSNAYPRNRDIRAKERKSKRLENKRRECDRWRSIDENSFIFFVRTSIYSLP